MTKAVVLFCINSINYELNIYCLLNPLEHHLSAMTNILIKLKMVQPDNMNNEEPQRQIQRLVNRPNNNIIDTDLRVAINLVGDL